MREKETTDLERVRAQEALLKHQEDVENYAKEIEKQKNAHSALEAKIQAMEGKVGSFDYVLKVLLKPKFTIGGSMIGAKTTRTQQA